MAQFVRDTMTGTGFLDLDDPLEHTPEAGGPWLRNPATPSTRWYLQSNQCHCGDPGAVYASGTPQSADYYTECDYIIYNPDTVGAGLTVRQSTSDLTMYLTRYEGGRYILAKWVAGSYTELGAYTVNHLGTTHKLRLTATGTSIVVAVDGVNRISVTDSSITAAGKAGMTAGAANDVGSGKHIDNFIAVDGAAASGARSYVLGIIG